ncbi:hypothetical protein [Kitasatospora sp. NPDC088351]|uniref:hypothetical protein n=1 Tax=Kitasatospora sp. NPDC088351 TaxID=3155180 RepID=UPI0034234371
MTDPAHTGHPPAARTNWALVHPVLAALTQAGVPLGRGDLQQLHHVAALGPGFVHTLARWLRSAHHAPPPPEVAASAGPPAFPEAVHPPAVPRDEGGAAGTRRLKVS